MWNESGEWIGLSAYINDAPWWAHAMLALVVIGLVLGMIGGFIEGLRRWPQ